MIPMISVYIHIPFCNKICTYCDFCKLFRNDDWIDNYLNELTKEIDKYYQNEEVKTLYIGGGTPSTLNINELEKLFQIIDKFNINKNAEITFEANSEDLTEEKLNYLKKHVNRLSIGIQTFDEKRLKTLNRTLNIQNIKNALKTFDNVNLDLMYGFQNQTLDDLKNDLSKIISLNPAHISTYSLILEPNTVLYNRNYQRLDDNHDRQMYDYITKYLKENGYNHYEISNYSKKGYESRHNLTYWNNENYYGFGLGASGYIKNIRYENTRSLNEYLKGNYLKEKIDVLTLHMDRLIDLKGEKTALMEMRKHASWYLRNVRGGGKLRQSIKEVSTREELVNMLQEFLKETSTRKNKLNKEILV